uniref:8-oxoguanine DNA glycosylase n=1 Tax=Echinostoma caproni TaxID=27848 RepID=A0A183B889_9TREM
LDKIHVVPVDVHMLRAARERAIPPAATVTNLTPKTYREISNGMSALWGEWAGWAQAVS